jgi:hypothetical protein
MKPKIGKWYYPPHQDQSGGASYLEDLTIEVRVAIENLLRLDKIRAMFLNENEYLLVSLNKDKAWLGTYSLPAAYDFKRVFSEQRRNNHIAIITIFKGIKREHSGFRSYM